MKHDLGQSNHLFKSGEKDHFWKFLNSKFEQKNVGIFFDAGDPDLNLDEKVHFWKLLNQNLIQNLLFGKLIYIFLQGCILTLPAMPLPGALQQELCGKSIRDAVYGSVQKMLCKSR